MEKDKMTIFSDEAMVIIHDNSNLIVFFLSKLSRSRLKFHDKRQTHNCPLFWAYRIVSNGIDCSNLAKTLITVVMARLLQLNKYRTDSICKWKYSENTSHGLRVTAMIFSL